MASLRCPVVAFFVFTTFTLAGALTGCASKMATIDDGRNAFVQGDLNTAIKVFTDVSQSSDRYASPAELDLAVVEIASGNVERASTRLRTLRDRFDRTSPAKRVVGETLAMVTDDTARTFKPAGYEEVMIRTMLSMCSLVSGDGDAESYINQAAMRQADLRSAAETQRKKFFPDLLDPAPHQELALAPYLRGVLREATHHDFDDAKRNYQLVSAIKPDFMPAFEDFQRASVGNHSQRDHGALYVFALVGRGPVLVPTQAPVTSAAVSIASTLLLNDDEKEDDVTRLPKITQVQIPGVVVPSSPISAVTVTAQTAIPQIAIPQIAIPQTAIPQTADAQYQLLGATQSLTDVAGLVQRQADAERPWIIARSFARQVGKELAVAKVRDGLNLDGGLGTAFQFVTTTAWTATEETDTRCWGLLPREIQVLRAELPVGDHAIHFAPVGPDGFSIGPERVKTVHIENGRNAYVVLIAPNEHIHVAN